MVERFRELGGGVGLVFLGVRERPLNDGEVGETNWPGLVRGLVGGDIDAVEGRS